MQKLIATKSMTYATRRLMPGDAFEARPADARLLIAIKKAKADRVPGTVPAPPASLAKQLRRDPLDHDGDGRKGGSAAPSQTDDLPKLRAEYFAAFGKRPFNGWDAETLRSKIAEATED